MSEQNATLRFFSGLAQVSAEVAGADSAVAVAARDAVEQPRPANFVRAQEELAQLPEELREKILCELHARMRADPEAIWYNLPNAPTAPDTNRPN